jgi:hypothetical protein
MADAGCDCLLSLDLAELAAAAGSGPVSLAMARHDECESTCAANSRADEELGKRHAAPIGNAAISEGRPEWEFVGI